MTQRARLAGFEFVRSIPAELQDGMLYVSVEYMTVVHRCMCGCGSEVVTSLAPHPRGWALEYDGETVSLFPSIGNAALTCQSHYWIRRNAVQWARPMGSSEPEAPSRPPWWRRLLRLLPGEIGKRARKESR